MKFEANTKTLFKVVATSSEITDITNGRVYDIYSDVDNEWFVIDDKGEVRLQDIGYHVVNILGFCI